MDTKKLLCYYWFLLFLLLFTDMIYFLGLLLAIDGLSEQT